MHIQYTVTCSFLNRYFEEYLSILVYYMCLDKNMLHKFPASSMVFTTLFQYLFAIQYKKYLQPMISDVIPFEELYTSLTRPQRGS